MGILWFREEDYIWKNTIMKKIVFIGALILTILVSSCGPSKTRQFVEKSDINQSVNENTARIIAYRNIDGSTFGITDIYCNIELVGYLGAMDYLSWEVPAFDDSSVFLFSKSASGKKARIYVKPQGTYYIRINMGFDAGNRFELVENEIGKKELTYILNEAE